MKSRHTLVLQCAVAILLLAGVALFFATRHSPSTSGLPVAPQVVEELGGRMKVYDLVDAGIADPSVREKATVAAFTSLYSRGGATGVTVLNVAPEGENGQPRPMEFRNLRAIPVSAPAHGGKMVRYSTVFRLACDGYRDRGGTWRRGTPPFLAACRMTVLASGMEDLKWVQVISVVTEPPLLFRNPAGL